MAVSTGKPERGLLLAFIIFLAGVSACAGEPAKDEQAQKPLEEMTVEELRTFQGFYYASGGRDPLTMRLPTAEELGGGKKENLAKTAPTVAQMEAFMTKALEDAKLAIKNLDYAEALRVTAEAIYIIDNEWPPINADLVHLVRMNEEIRNYNRLAERLKRQVEIKKEFDSLYLRINGVIWSPIDAKAVVNGRTLSAGEVMLMERKEGDLRVEMIEEHGVVFQFKGMRFRMPVEIYAPEPAVDPTKK